MDALDEAISLLECLEYSEKRELQIEELKYKRKYQNYKTDGFENLLYSFEPYTDIEELERDLSINYYGTWYANDSTENFEYGKGYKYPHDFENSKVTQQYLPDALVDKKYFIPKEWEKNLGENL